MQVRAVCAARGVAYSCAVCAVVVAHWSQGKHGPDDQIEPQISLGLLSLSADFNGSAPLQHFFAIRYAGRFG